MAANVTATHPYYPLGVDIPGYVANTLSTQTILAIFSTACAGALLPALFLIRRAAPKLSTADLTTAMWFVLCGCIHLVLEGPATLDSLSLVPTPPSFIRASLNESLSPSCTNLTSLRI